MAGRQIVPRLRFDGLADRGYSSCTPLPAQPGFRVRIHRLTPYLRRHRGALIIGLVAIILGDLLLLSAPWWLRRAIDGLEAGDLEASRRAALLMLSVTAAGGFFKFIMRRWMIGASRWMELEIRRDFTAHLFSLSPSFFDRHKVGDLMALATNDLNAIRMMLGPGIMYVVNTAVTLAVALALMLTLSPKLTLVALLPLPLLAIAVQQGSRLTYSRYAKVPEQVDGPLGTTQGGLHLGQSHGSTHVPGIQGRGHTQRPGRSLQVADLHLHLAEVVVGGGQVWIIHQGFTQCLARR